MVTINSEFSAYSVSISNLPPKAGTTYYYKLKLTA